MSFTNRISQALHDEHRSTVALMERLEQLIARHRRGDLPDVGDSAVAKLLADLSTGLEHEVQRHFDFEEDRLFTYLGAAGDAAIGAHLTDEHIVMRPLGMQIVKLAREAATTGFDGGRWEAFCRVGRELCERLLAHVQKEEMALLPLIEDRMDADTEARLVEEYLETA
jgi:hemerythrin-like domain-containing protein